MRYLGIDLGSKTIGLAMSDTTLTIASTYKTIFFKNEDFIVKYWLTGAFTLMITSLVVNIFSTL